jgi:hypothetical protein
MERGANMTRQIPMLFSPAMIEALLAGRKTETRRILKPQPESFATSPGVECEIYPLHIEGETRPRIAMGKDGSGVLTAQKCRCAPGDLIWVREGWRIGAWRTEQWSRGPGECDADVAIDYLADNYARKEWLQGDDPEMMLRLVDQSRADAETDGRFKPDAEFQYCWPPGDSPCRKRPSIHMPKFASRLTLRVTGHNIERLHDISSRSCLAEGVQPVQEILQAISAAHSEKHRRDEYHRAHVAAYRSLWNRINGADAWDANPWVTVTKFEVIRQNVLEVAS